MPPYTITLQFIKQYVVVNSIKCFPEINKNTFIILFYVKKVIDKVGHFNQCK